MALQQLFHCPNCNAALDLEGDSAVIVRCDFCHSTVIVPESLRQKSGLAPKEKVVPKKPPKPVKPTLTQDEAVAKVTQLARDRQKIEAMQLYRETFPVGLKEAKEAIEQVEAGHSLPIPEARWEDEGDLPVEAAEEIVRLISAGSMDQAAKLYRVTFDTSNVEAESAVRQLAEGKSIDVARQAAKRKAQATAVRRPSAPEPSIGRPRSLLPLIVFVVLLFLFVLVVLGLVLTVL